MHDLVIIGSGPAGMTAAIYGVRSNLSVLLLDRLAPGGQIVNTNEIQNYPGMGTINGAELAIRMYQHTQELGVEFDYLTVTGVTPGEGGFSLSCAERPGDPVEARAVIVATGTTPRTLGVEGEDRLRGNGLSWCAVCDGAACRDQDVVVVGGGNSAVEEALFLSELASSVTVLVRRTMRADPAACDRLRARGNVTVMEGWNAVAFEGSTCLEAVRARCTETGEERLIACQHAFEYVGLEPVTSFVTDLGILDEAGYVIVDSGMGTSVPGVFACGDCIEKDLRQVVTACSDGAIAARSAARWLKNAK